MGMIWHVVHDKSTLKNLTYFKKPLIELMTNVTECH